jgi:hypothetical protein
MWRTVGKDVSRRGLATFEARFHPPERRAIDGGTLWLIELPPATGAREAAWVGVLRWERAANARVAYFTLEVGTRVGPNDPPYHVVCEWQPNGFAASPARWRHWNSCLHCAPDAAAFTRAIATALTLRS